MSENHIEWTVVHERISALLEASRAQLDTDAIAFVEHQLRHDEYETALEGLCLSLTTMPDAAKKTVDWGECTSLGKLLRLDAESVLDPDFWAKLSAASHEYFRINLSEEQD